MSTLRFLASQNGVVGMNRRNRFLVHQLNDRKHYPLVDDKLRAKERLAKFGLPVPQTIHVFESMFDTRGAGEVAEDLDEFVVKPARGRRGQGILILKRENGVLRNTSGRKFSPRRLQSHIRLILCGEFSLGNREDAAFIEEMIHPPEWMTDLYGTGVADVRVIVHLGVPVMAMVRLPTRGSDGRANLHAGGIGVGIEMDTGRAIRGVFGNRTLASHPDTGRELSGWSVPGWSELLAIARRCYQAVPLGYLGVDLVLDVLQGALVVELNARPGLNIQLANGRGLWTALDAAGTLHRLGTRGR